MVSRVDRKLGSAPVTQETLLEFVNKELVPVVEKLRLLTSALLDIVIQGSGSPEGVVFANTSALYLNQTGSPGSLLWSKTTDEVSTGWVAIA